MSIELLNIDKGYAVFSKSNYQTRKHSHYAIEIVCCSQGSFSIETNEGSYNNLKNVIIPSNVSHSFSCTNATCDLLFADPLSAMGRYFVQQYQLASQERIWTNIAELNQFYTGGNFAITRILDAAEITNAGDLDERIVSCMQTIDTLVTGDAITLAQLSHVSFLSEGRLAHLFKSQLGISVHQYILWKKILVAMQKARGGYSLTECAHYVGFADSSHFNKVFYKMFGIKPFFVLKT